MSSITDDLKSYLERHGHRHPTVIGYIRHAYIVGASAAARAVSANPAPAMTEIIGLAESLLRDDE